MISTRVMDFKLREAAEGLGEDSTGKASLLLLWGESSLGCEAGGGADGTRPLGFSAWRVGVQFTECSDTPILRPEDLQCRGSSFASVRHGGQVNIIFLIPIPMFDLIERCSGIIYYPRTPEGTSRRLAKYKVA